jgi:hypothetical protein
MHNKYTKRTFASCLLGVEIFSVLDLSQLLFAHVLSCEEMNVSAHDKNYTNA